MTSKITENLWGYAKRLRFVIDSIARVWPDTDPPMLTVLDVGCGNGAQLGVPLAEAGYHILGIDMHAPSIAEAKRLSAGLEKAVFETLEVDEVDDMAFDVVLLSEVLEHVEKPDELLTESLKKMKNGGLMIVTVPNGYGEFEWDSWMFSRLGLERLVEKYEARRTESRRPGPTASTENHDNRHIQFFTLRRLRKMFADAGLVIEREAGSTVFGGPFAGHTLARSSRFISWNASAADRLPMSMASGWYFALRRSGPR